MTYIYVCFAAYFELSPTPNGYTHNGRLCEGFKDNSSQEGVHLFALGLEFDRVKVGDLVLVEFVSS
jgi:hypothetical protein